MEERECGQAVREKSLLCLGPSGMTGDSERTPIKL